MNLAVIERRFALVFGRLEVEGKELIDCYSW